MALRWTRRFSTNAAKSMISTQVLAAGKIYTNIGKVAGRSRTNITQKFFAQQAGMWQLTGCAVVELDTDEEWVMPNLLDVVVVEASDGVATPSLASTTTTSNRFGITHSSSVSSSTTAQPVNCHMPACCAKNFCVIFVRDRPATFPILV